MEMKMRKLNAREQLEAATRWLGYHHEDLSYALNSPEDGLKLWHYSRAHPKLAEFCDCFDGEEGDWTRKDFMAAIGYVPSCFGQLNQRKKATA